MATNAMLEWLTLGSRLRSLCPDKFAEIVDALRETVGVHELLAPGSWQLGLDSSVEDSGKA